MKGCDAILEDLPGYVSGKLTASERSAVDAHMRSCDGCTSELRSMERLEHLLLGLPKVEPSPDLRSRFANRLAAEIEAEEARAERAGVFRWLMRPWLVPALGTAAVAVWVLAGALGGNRDGAPQIVAKAPSESVDAKVEVARSTAPENVAPEPKANPAMVAAKAVVVADSQDDAVPAELESKPELFVDFDVIRELEELEGRAGSAG